MNVSILTNYAEKFLQENFGLSLAIPIERNNRLRSSYGCFVYDDKEGKALRIEIAGLMFDYAREEAIYSVLRHECIHYALYVLKRPHRDGDAYFEAMLRRHHATSTNTLKVGKYFLFQCNHCHQTYETKIKRVAKSPGVYQSKCCASDISLTGEKIYRGSDIDA